MTVALRVHAALREAEDRFANAGFDAVRIESTALLAHVLGVDRAGLLSRLADPLAARDQDLFLQLVERRLAHEPLQYLVGTASFLDFEVRVGPGVFIPRPETELLVESALAHWPPAAPLAIDLCTGNGAIAIALARARPNARILAIEVADAPLRYAAASAHDNGVADRIDFIRGDLLGSLAGNRSELGAIVCNPPYAARGEVVQPEVAEHEPRLAWEGGARGTEVYERLIPEAARLLPPDRPLLLEIGHDQSRSVPDLLARDGRWSRAALVPDFQDIDRVLIARRAAP